MTEKNNSMRQLINFRLEKLNKLKEKYPTNWELSAARAASVASYFESSMSINSARIEVAGFGETVPVDTNNTAAGRANNRRIEIKIPD
mgnify:CR=1 FL=1